MSLHAGNTPEVLWAKVVESLIWESSHDISLGLTIDTKLNFETTTLCKKGRGKVSALAKLVNSYILTKKDCY